MLIGIDRYKDRIAFGGGGGSSGGGSSPSTTNYTTGSQWNNPDVGRPTRPGEVTTGPNQSAQHWASGGSGSSGIGGNDSGGSISPQQMQLFTSPEVVNKATVGAPNNPATGTRDPNAVYTAGPVGDIQNAFASLTGNQPSNLPIGWSFDNQAGPSGGGGSTSGTQSSQMQTMGTQDTQQASAPAEPQITSQQAQNAYQDALDDLMGRTRSGFERELGRRGLDFDDFGYVYEDNLDRIQDRLPGVDTSDLRDSYDLMQYYDPSFAPNVLDEYQQGRRSRYEQQVGDFAPTDFQYGMVGQDFGNDAVDRILNEAMRDTQQYLQRGHARGSLTDVGFNRANEQMQNQVAGARSTVGDAADSQRGVLRNALTEIADRARQGASGFQLGQRFDPGNYQQQIDDRLTRGTENFEGNLRNVIGDQELFDQQGLYRQGGIAQGVQNAGPNQLIGALMERQRSRMEPRGVGNRGTF